MNDQTWGVVIGAAAVIVLRVADWFLPKGRYSKWAREHSVKAEDEEDD